MKSLKNNNRSRYYSMFAIFLFAAVLSSNILSAKNVYIDAQVKNFPSVKNQNESVAQLISHGRPGALLLDGKWRNANEIVTFIKAKHLVNRHTISLNIYGCEFAKGSKGLQAVAIIKKDLGIAVAASSNITGKHGDWKLEVGNKNHDVLNIPNYPYDLQTICSDTTYTPVNAGWTAAPAAPSYSYPAGCGGTNYGTTTNADNATDRGFDTWYDSPSGYVWSRTLNGLDATKKYRVYINMYSYSNASDKRDSYFQNYNLAGQTGTFTCHGNTNVVDQTIYNFIVTNKTSLSFSGTIVASAWNQCEQAVNYRVQIVVQEVVTNITYTAPTLTANTASNECPALTTNLTGKAMGCGNGSNIEWHTTNIGYSNSNKVPDITNVADGMYYAVCYNPTKGCYSAASAAITVTNTICVPLPIDFKSNNAEWKDNDATISWTVANEENSNYFNVERSFNGKDFNEIAQVKSIGNHKNDYNYTYTDVNVKPQTTDKVFYRIKQMDIDGTSNATNIMMLTINDSKDVAYVYPNPIVSDNFNFVYQNNSIQNTSMTILLVDAYGRTLYQTEKSIAGGKNIIPISTNGLNAGMYFLQYIGKEANSKGVIRVVKK